MLKRVSCMSKVVAVIVVIVCVFGVSLEGVKGATYTIYLDGKGWIDPNLSNYNYWSASGYGYFIKHIEYSTSNIVYQTSSQQGHKIWYAVKYKVIALDENNVYEGVDKHCTSPDYGHLWTDYKGLVTMIKVPSVCFNHGRAIIYISPCYSITFEENSDKRGFTVPSTLWGYYDGQGQLLHFFGGEYGSGGGSGGGAGGGEDVELLSGYNVDCSSKTLTQYYISGIGGYSVTSLAFVKIDGVEVSATIDTGSEKVVTNINGIGDGSHIVQYGFMNNNGKLIVKSRTYVIDCGEAENVLDYDRFEVEFRSIQSEVNPARGFIYVTRYAKGKAGELNGYKLHYGYEFNVSNFTILNQDGDADEIIYCGGWSPSFWACEVKSNINGGADVWSCIIEVNIGGKTHYLEFEFKFGASTIINYDESTDSPISEDHSEDKETNWLQKIFKVINDLANLVVEFLKMIGSIVKAIVGLVGVAGNIIALLGQVVLDVFKKLVSGIVNYKDVGYISLSNLGIKFEYLNLQAVDNILSWIKSNISDGYQGLWWFLALMEFVRRHIIKEDTDE